MKVRKFTLFLILVLGLIVTFQVMAEYSLAADKFSAAAHAIVSNEGSSPVSVGMASGKLPENDYTITEGDPLPSTLNTVPEFPIPGDPYVEKQWALSQIGVFNSWSATRGNPEVLVAVLDTGIDGDHEDLDGKVIAVANFTDSSTTNDIHGHGTHIAGIIAAISDNDIGVAGVTPECSLMNAKVADDKGRCQASDVAEAIIWVVDNGASVINISIELVEPSLELEDAINYAWRQGVITITAAGNDGSQAPVYPAYYEKCITVAATKPDDTLAPLSNYGDWVDVAAPGFNIYSTMPGDSYGYKTGTSFATAYVSGLAALLFDVTTDNNGDGRVNDEIRAAIEAGCQEIGITGVGKGRINVDISIAEVN